MSTVIGIDLGTTYSCVGVMQEGRVEIIANDQGNRTTPSWVAFNDTERLIGDAAKSQAAMNPRNTIYDAKRLIGRSFSDTTVQTDLKHYSYNVTADSKDRPVINVEYKGENKTFYPEEISAMVLTKMKEIAEEEQETVEQMFKACVDEEKAWANYLFKEGSMIGLNERLLHNYVEWIANRRMKAIGLKPIYDQPLRNNPLPWTEHWLTSKGQQNAPQETEIESYVVGGIKQDVTKDTFAGFSL